MFATCGSHRSKRNASPLYLHNGSNLNFKNVTIWLILNFAVMSLSFAGQIKFTARVRGYPANKKKLKNNDNDVNCSIVSSYFYLKCVYWKQFLINSWNTFELWTFELFCIWTNFILCVMFWIVLCPRICVTLPFVLTTGATKEKALTCKSQWDYEMSCLKFIINTNDKPNCCDIRLIIFQERLTILVLTLLLLPLRGHHQ